MRTSILPTGTVTFLFTDIEGSTKRWETQPRQMSAALSRHDAVLRSTIEDAGGHVFKTVGDAFCAAFATPHDALAAALAAQQALFIEQWDAATGPITVRMALHIGVAEERDGDYFGQPVNRVARLLSAGHGGQVLLSDPIYDLARDNLPSGVELRDLGEHRLKDLTRPERIFQLVAPGLTSEFPPLRTLDSRPNNLPRQQTMLVGREAETEAVCALLRGQGSTLVTLTGPGGTGKTRLALQVAAEMLEEFHDGCWFVGLAALTAADHSRVASTIANELGVSERPSEPLAETLKTALSHKEMLLVLDNFEQVMDAAPLVSDLLKATGSWASPNSGLKVLVTSRVALRVYGEKEYAVPPLRLPDTRPGHLPDLGSLTQYEAVRLFIERARDVKSDFQVTNDNAPAVAEICARLDGLPLAIELAAARVRMLPPHALLSRLSSRLKILTGGARDLPARQQTLRNTIEWSYDLLDQGQKQFFRRIAVFQGGRTLEGLEAVCNYDRQLQVDVFEGVDALVSNSLLQQREGSDGEPRFWMLETIHEYAHEKLQASGEAEPLQREHALYFMRLAEEAEPHLIGAKQQEWLNRLEDEHDNLRYALQWARAESEKGNPEAAEIGLRTAGALWRFWWVRGYLSEGREQLEGALFWGGIVGGTPGGIPETLRGARAKGLHGGGVLATWQGDAASAQSRLEESLAIYRELGDKRGIAYLLGFLAENANDQGDTSKARALFEEGLAMSRKLGDKLGIAWALRGLAGLALDQGDFAVARALHEESMAMYRESGYKRGISSSLASLGTVAIEQGDYAAGRALVEESLTIARELADKTGIVNMIVGVGIVEMLEGKYASARSFLEEGLAMRRELGDVGGIAWSLCDLGNVAILQGDHLAARSLYEESLKMDQKLGHSRERVIVCLVGLAGAAAGIGEGEKGARLLGASDALREALGVRLWEVARIMYNHGAASARSQLSEEAFERAMQEGRAMSMEQAIEYALEEKE